MNKFARLFELDDHQVLLMKDYDDEEEKILCISNNMD